MTSPKVQRQLICPACERCWQVDVGTWEGCPGCGVQGAPICACGCGASLSGFRRDAVYRSDACRKRHLRTKSADKERVKNRARQKVAAAVDRGTLVRPDHCENCGAAANPKLRKPNIEAHHADYSRPLEVEWLCGSCHARLHTKEREARRQSRNGHGTRLYVTPVQVALLRVGMVPIGMKRKLAHAAERVAA